MNQTVIVIESNSNGLYELCIGEYEFENSTRLRHEDFNLTREELWKLKQQVDRAWIKRGSIPAA